MKWHSSWQQKYGPLLSEWSKFFNNYSRYSFSDFSKLTVGTKEAHHNKRRHKICFRKFCAAYHFVRGDRAFENMFGKKIVTLKRSEVCQWPNLVGITPSHVEVGVRVVVRPGQGGWGSTHVAIAAKGGRVVVAAQAVCGYRRSWIGGPPKPRPPLGKLL